MDDSDDLMAQAASLNRSFEGTDLFGAGGGMDIGGVEPILSVPALEFGQRVILVNRPCDLCLGMIHGGQRMCLASSSCTVATHQQKGKKFVPTVVEPFLVVAGPTGRNNSPTAYVNPILPTSLLEDDLKEMLMQTSSDDIGAILNTVWDRNIRHAQELEGVMEAPKTARKLINEAKSPSKISQRTQVQDLLKRLGSIQSNLISEFAINVPMDNMVKLAELESSDAAFTSNIKDTIDYLSQAVEKLTKAVKGCIQSVTLHTNLRSDEIKILTQTTDEINSSLDQVSSTLGKRSADAAGLTEPSLWSFASATRSTQVEHKGAIQGMLNTLSSMGSQIRGLQERVDNLVSQRSATSTVRINEPILQDSSLFGGNFNPTTGATPVGPKIQNGILRPTSRGAGGYASGEDLNGIRVTGGGNYFGGGGGLNPTFQGSGDGSGRGNNGGNGGWNATGNFGDPDPSGDDGESPLNGDVWSTLLNHEKRIDALERRKKGDGSESIFWRGFTFHTPADIGAFFERICGEKHVIKFGCFANPYQLLDECTRRLTAQFKTTKDVKEILALQLRGIEVRSYLSLDSGCNLPYIFATAERLAGFTYLTKPGKYPGARFTAIPSGTDFATLEDRHGLYPAMIDALKNVKAGIEKDIALHYGKHYRISNLATHMLTVSSAFVEDVLSFMCQTHAALLKSFKGEEKAWECVCKSVEDLWTTQLVPATAEMASADLTDRELFSILCMWTSLKVTSIAGEVSTNKIASHPDITSSYVRFLIDHVGASQTSALRESMDAISELKTELANTKRELVALKGHVGSVESRIDKSNSKKK